MADERPGFKDILGQLKKNPMLLGVIIVGIIGVIFIIYKQNQQINGSGTTNPTTPAQASGGSMGSGSTAPTTTLNQFFYAKPQGQGTAGANQPSGSNTPLHLQPDTNATSMTTAPANQTLTIRPQGGNAQVSSYDVNAKGVPIWSSPNATPGSQIGTINFGSQVQEQGPGVTGGSNFGPNSTGGSNLWYKVTSGGKTGYVSAYDVQSSS